MTFNWIKNFVPKNYINFTYKFSFFKFISALHFSSLLESNVNVRYVRDNDLFINGDVELCINLFFSPVVVSRVHKLLENPTNFFFLYVTAHSLHTSNASVLLQLSLKPSQVSQSNAMLYSFFCQSNYVIWLWVLETNCM